MIFLSVYIQEKQELLAKWVNSGENINAVECELQVMRKQEGELERGRELLTIAEMQSRGFSQIFAIVHSFNMFQQFLFFSKLGQLHQKSLRQYRQFDQDPDPKLQVIVLLFVTYVHVFTFNFTPVI